MAEGAVGAVAAGVVAVWLPMVWSGCCCWCSGTIGAVAVRKAGVFLSC